MKHVLFGIGAVVLFWVAIGVILWMLTYAPWLAVVCGVLAVSIMVGVAATVISYDIGIWRKS